MFVLLATSACLLFVMPQQVTAGYSVGVGIADVTGPSAEVGFVSIPAGWFSFVPVLKPGCTCLPATTPAVASYVQDLGSRSGVEGRLSLGQQFPTFETPYCRPLRSRSILTVGLPNLKMATIGNFERWGTSDQATTAHRKRTELNCHEQLLLVGSELPAVDMGVCRHVVDTAFCRHGIL
jgi:hypothetical protein